MLLPVLIQRIIRRCMGNNKFQKTKDKFQKP